MKVLWAQRARNRLREIYRYVSKSSPARAIKLCDDLLAAADQLKSHPYSGPLLPEDPAYRQLVTEGCRIVYRVTDKSVLIMTIIGPGMSYERAI